MQPHTKTQLTKILFVVLVNIAVLLYIEFKENDEERYQTALTAYQNNQFTKTFNIMSSLAGDEIPEAENFLANLYLKGHGVEANKELAIFWFKKAATHGNKEAQEYIKNNGILIENESSVP